jgi:hypothetical protein
MSTSLGKRSQGSRITQATMTALGFQQISPAVSTALTVPDGAEIALFSVEVAAIRFRDDGVAPTAAIGQIIPAGLGPFEFFGNLTALRVIAASAGGILNVTYYG